MRADGTAHGLFTEAAVAMMKEKYHGSHCNPDGRRGRHHVSASSAELRKDPRRGTRLFALTLSSELRGEDAARCLRLALGHASAPPFDADDADRAPAHIRYMVMDQLGKLMGNARQRVERVAGEDARA